MKIESLDNSGDTAMSIIFEPQEVPIISEINTFYLTNEYAEDPEAYLASTIISDSQEFYNGDTSLRIDLGHDEQSVFIEKMSQASTLYLGNQVMKWRANTTMHPNWFLAEKNGTGALSVDLKQFFSPGYLAHLDQEAKKLTDAKKLTIRFQQLDRAIYE